MQFNMNAQDFNENGFIFDYHIPDETMELHTAPINRSLIDGVVVKVPEERWSRDRAVARNK